MTSPRPRTKKKQKNANTSKEKASLAGEILERFKGVPRGLELWATWKRKGSDVYPSAQITVQEIVSLAGVALNDTPDRPSKRITTRGRK